LLGIGAAARIAEFPQLPTIGETVPGFEAGAWWGLFAPAGIPGDVTEKINTEVGKLLVDAAVRAQLIVPHNLQVFTGSPAELAAFVDRERQKWQRLVRDAGIKVQ
jgi:tripartite-type tricarboxylate transporter receptor subunit TctC